MKEKIAASESMDLALRPRTKEGFIVPMIFSDEPQQQMHYPHFKHSAKGIRPMVTADEFEDGRIPEDLEYLPAHENPNREPFNGSNFDVIVYEDPVQNLPHQQWLLLQQTIQIPSWGLPALKEAVSDAQDEKESTKLAPPSFEEGIQLETAHGVSVVSNFDVEVKERRIYIQRNEEVRSEILVTVRCLGTEHNITLATTEVDSALKVIQRRIPEAVVTPEAKNAALHVANMIRRQLAACPVKTILRSNGFAKVGGQWTYVHDGADSPDKSVIFQTGKRIGCAPGFSRRDAVLFAMGILSLSPHLELMLPLLLLMHLGPLFELFRQAGHSPRFVTFLAGTTGSLKTSIALALFRLFEEDAEQPEANFLDTETALELKLGHACSRVFLVDDFCPAVTTASGKQKLAKLELIIRFVGDQISKSRSNPQLTLAEESTPAGCCIVTGESTGGSRSTLLRCLVLSVARGDIDGAALERYQTDPKLLQTHMNHFLIWCGNHGGLIIDFIKGEFPSERQHFASIVRERRLADTGACLMLTANLLLEYAVEVQAMKQEERSLCEDHWRKNLESAIKASEAATKDLDPVTMFLKALLDLRHAGKLPLAPEVASYSAEKHLGFQRGDQWWVRPTDTYQLAVKYWKGLGHIFPLRETEIRKLLAVNNLLEIERENTADGREKILYTRKTSLPYRPRMLVLRIAAAQEHLERELGESELF